MYPNGESVGIVLDEQEVALAQFAYQRAQDNMRTYDELMVPKPDEKGLFYFGDFSAHQILSAAMVARRISDHNLLAANNRYVERRHDHAEPEELQVLFIEKQSEEENVAHFGELYAKAEACLGASQDMLIDRKLSTGASDAPGM